MGHRYPIEEQKGELQCHPFFVIVSLMKSIQGKVAIIVINWNGVKFLENCLTSVMQQTYSYFDVYFVDNGSTDISVQYVTNHFPEAKVIKLATNTGFAFANNVGIQHALKDPEVEYIFTLNNDTKLAHDVLQLSIDIINKQKHIGAVAPKMKFFYEPDLIDSIGILIHPDGSGVNRGGREEDQGQYDQSEEVFGVCAGAALYKRALVEDILYRGEFFDNSFFAYSEDLDVAWRARLRGWKCFSCPQAVVRHVHSATSIAHSPFKSYHMNRNRFFVMIKDLPFTFLVKAVLLTPMRYIRLMNSMRIKQGSSYKLQQKSGKLTPFIIVVKGWGSVIVYLPSLLRKRRHIQKRRVVSAQETQQWFNTFCASTEQLIYK